MLKYRPSDGTQPKPSGPRGRQPSRAQPEGEYDAIVAEVTETVSKAGDDMYVIVFTVIGPRHRSSVKDFIVPSKAAWRLHRLAEALHADEEYKAGTFDPQDYIGATLRLDLKVEANPPFPDRNKVNSYLSAAQPVSRKAAATVRADEADGEAAEEIPF